MRHLTHTSLLLAGVVTAGLVPLAVPTPASASVSGTTSSPDVVLYDQCQTHTVDYAIATTPGTTFWRLEIQVHDPTGATSEGTVATSNLSALTGTASTIFCGSEAPGVWTVRATGYYQVIPGANVAYALPDSTFTVRRAATQTTLTKQRLRHHRVRLVTSVTQERPGGYGPADGAPVELQRLVDGTWVKVSGASGRTSGGRTTTIVRVPHGAAFRAVTTGIGNYSGSTSPTLTVR